MKTLIIYFKVLAGMALLCGVIITIMLTLNFTISAVAITIFAQRTQAIVTFVTDTRNPDGTVKYHTIVSFTDSKGRTINTALDDISATPQYKVGDQLRLLYTEPTRRSSGSARIDDLWAIWKNPLIMAGIALVTVGIAYVLLKKTEPNKERWREKVVKKQRQKQLKRWQQRQNRLSK
jgi:hypothetical protein